MNTQEALDNEKTRRVAMAPLCMVLGEALRHVPEEYVVSHLMHKELVKWVSGSKVDKILRMRPTLHDEVSRASKKFVAWDKKPEKDGEGNGKGRGPLYTFAALRALENASTACMNGDGGDLAEAIGDLDDIPLEPPGEKKNVSKIKTKKQAPPTTLADVLRSLGEVLALRPQLKGASKAS